MKVSLTERFDEQQSFENYLYLHIEGKEFYNFEWNEKRQMILLLILANLKDLNIEIGRAE